MTEDVQMGEEGARVLGLAEELCRRSNVSILAPEHLLSAALLVLGQRSAGLPSNDEVTNALLATQGIGHEAVDRKVMFGSAARDALSNVARGLHETGQRYIDAKAIACGVTRSGEVNPMFFATLGWAKERLLAAIEKE